MHGRFVDTILLRDFYRIKVGIGRRLRTDGEGGGKFATPEALAEKVRSLWPDSPSGKPLVVCTGGEPLMQLDQALVDALHACGFQIAVETNGTQAAPQGLDWICVSPKAGAPLVLTEGTELKLVFPQPGAMPEQFAHLRFTHYFLQPMDGLEQKRNTRLAVEYCMANPQWRLSVQTHKVVGIA